MSTTWPTLAGFRPAPMTATDRGVNSRATDAASALTAATHRSAVALQIEGTGPRRLDWWSVVIQGRADLLNPAELTLLESPCDDTGTSRQRWVRIEVRRIVGQSAQEGAEVT